MKKCHGCPKPAVYHITEVRHGDVKKELHFCEEHFHDYMTRLDQPAAEDESGVPQAIQDLADDAEAKRADDVSCPNCGITFREFREHGRFGCPLDYDIFKEQLAPLLENIHGETQHAGKAPKGAPAGSRHQYELIRLRRELAAAIEQEEYEAAAKLRDEIQAFEAKASGRSSQ
jgi:protein arginine kinase activator